MNWTTENLDILKSYLQQGFKQRQIALKMNCSFDSVGHAVRRYGLDQYRVVTPAVQKIVDSIDLASLKDENFAQLKEEAKLVWVPAKTRVPKNKKKPYQTILVTSDHHVPHQDQVSINAVLDLMDDVKFDVNIILGDFLDFGCISHWNQGRQKTLEMQRLKKDYIAGNVLLDEMDKRLPAGCEKHFFKGNHEVWIDDLLEKTPQLEGLVEPESQLKLIERGYKIYQYNDVIEFGKLNLTHGIYAGANPTKKHLDELKVNIMFGHTHTMEVKMSSSAARKIAFSGYNVGCLCHMCPDYMRNRPSGWTNGIAIIYLYPNGYFEVNMIRILEGRFIYNNKIYDGNR
jgi:predicted phosphodiesterase